MRSRSLLVFIILNIFISAGVALGLLSFLGSSGGEAQIVPVTVQIIVTPTPDPDGDATRVAFAVERTVTAELQFLESTATVVNLPEDIAAGLIDQPTINPDTIAANPGIEGTVSALPDGCVAHEIASGDTPFGIGDQYGVSGFSIMAANGLTEETATQLQIGQVVIVPLPNCPLDELLENLVSPTPEITETPTPTPTPEGTPESFDADSDGTPDPTETPTVTPTATLALAPTAVSAQVEIVEVISPGDITAEGVSIINRGSVVDVSGWILTDAQGNEFEFPEQRLFTNGSVIIYTRAGENTPVVFYWGRSTAVWGDENDLATLTDANGQVQSAVRVDEVER